MWRAVWRPLLQVNQCGGLNGDLCRPKVNGLVRSLFWAGSRPCGEPQVRLNPGICATLQQTGAEIRDRPGLVDNDMRESETVVQVTTRKLRVRLERWPSSRQCGTTR
ncbi:hypothetical protein RRG08_032498 [Elysia crispata]|uniref:Uncharacterized protein n=1 Tax=Elysia crispata TaxID=231223 RepID=A0AAE0ZXJ5_9GAST|nr:hypothetical protein RRG08_032498 [Elysia crispata]